MKFKNKTAILNIINKNACPLVVRFPSYDHIILNNKIYPIKLEPNIILPNKIIIGSNYISFKIKFSGFLNEDIGFMPNPLWKQEFIHINKIKVIE